MALPCFITVTSPSPAFLLLLLLLLVSPPSISIFSNGSDKGTSIPWPYITFIEGGIWRDCSGEEEGGGRGGGGGVVLSQTPSQVGMEPSLCLSPPYSPLCLRTGFLCLEKLVVFLMLFSTTSVLCIFTSKTTDGSVCGRGQSLWGLSW